MQATEQGNKMIKVQFRDKINMIYLHQKLVTRAFLAKCFHQHVVVGLFNGLHVIDI